MSILTSIHLTAGAIVAVGPNPTPTAPPGSQGLLTILGWVSWIVFGLAVAGVLLVAGKMAVDHNQGRGGNAASGLIWVLGGCILAAVASGLVGAIVTASGGSA